MLRTFNCGIGMVLVVDANAASSVEAVLQRHGETVVTLGQIVARENAAVAFRGRLNLDG